MLIKPDGFMLYGKLGKNFFSISELPYPNMTIRKRLIRARLRFYIISDNPNVSVGVVDCSIYTRRIVLKGCFSRRNELTNLHILLWSSAF